MAHSWSPGLKDAQDFGEEFTFHEDRGALESILNNQGLSYVSQPNKHFQVQPSCPRTPGFTPAKNVPEKLKKHENKFEFFEGKSGQVFFRKRMVPGSGQKVFNNTESSAKKSGFGRGMRGRSAASGLKPQRLGMMSVKKEPLIHPNHHQSPRIKSGAKPLPVRTPLAVKNPNTGLISRHQAAVTEKKIQTSHQPVPKYCLSEEKMKAPSGLPRPVMTMQNQARQSLKFGNKQNDVKKPAAPALIEPSIMRLTRESMRLIPRESLAWLSQLPRDSATFAELEKMMNDDDKQCANEDDTDSFEALESRLKTPYKSVPSNLVFEPPPQLDDDKENKEDNNVSGVEALNDDSVVQNSFEVAPADDIGEVSVDTTPEAKKIDFEEVAEEVDDDEEELNMMNNDESIINQTEDDPKPKIDSVPVMSPVSVIDNVDKVEDMSQLDSRLNKYQEELDNYREEADSLARQMEELMMMRRERKMMFKENWGVSPKDIKSKMTILESRSAFILNKDSWLADGDHIDEVRDDNNANDYDVREDDDDVQDAMDDEEAQTPDQRAVMMPAPETEKRVRFNSGGNQTQALTPLDLTPVSSLGKTRKQSRKSFDTLKTSLAFLKTPQTVARARPSLPSTAAATPMALRYPSLSIYIKRPVRSSVCNPPHYKNLLFKQDLK